MISTVPQPTTPTAVERRPERVRHTLRFRYLRVLKSERPTPNVVRITLGGPDMDGFHSPGFDDHMKLFFANPETGILQLPSVGPEGPVWPEGPRPIARDYTPHHHDPVAGTVQVDFVMHDAGPATAWARTAEPGDLLGVGGPRGSFMVPLDYEGHVLIGDETALPAIARRLAELPAQAKALVLIEVHGPADEVPLPTAAQAQIHWLHRQGSPASPTPLLLSALRACALPSTDLYCWVGCESSVAKALRTHLVEERGVQPKGIRASGYWRQGASGTHDSHD